VAAAAIPYAGFGGAEDRHRSIIDKPFAEWREVLNVNLDGVFLVDRAVARAMVKAGRGGRIINISSIMAMRPAVNSSDYCVSKAGNWMLTKVLALELAPHGITVNAIAPGGVRTPMLQAALDRNPGMEQGILANGSAAPYRRARRTGQHGAVPGQRRSRLLHRRADARERRYPDGLAGCGNPFSQASDAGLQHCN
jgi:NAD(P)-dependent dehydrogenase (short-subunit alcohol dehydrogenase family)